MAVDPPASLEVAAFSRFNVVRHRLPLTGNPEGATAEYVRMEETIAIGR